MSRWTIEDERRLERDICLGAVALALFSVLCAVLAVKSTFF